MKNKVRILYNLWINESFLYFAMSQGFMSFGETFRLIAVTTLIVKATGSGLAAGFGLICSSLPSLLFSLFAGSLGDRFNEKYLMVAVDLLRGSILIFLTFNTEVDKIYISLFTLSSLEAFYYPSRNKLMINILDKSNLIIGNSVLSGCIGIAYLIGPPLAGFVLAKYSVKSAFFINSITFIISATLLLNVNNRYLGIKRFSAGKTLESFPNGVFIDIKKAFLYCGSVKEIVEIIIVFTFISFGTISINTAFYSLAFDIYKVTSWGWGIMLSVFYGTSIIAMSISIMFKKFIEKHLHSIVKILLIIISSAWFCYSRTNGISNVLVLQIIEGTSISLATICLNTRLQIVAGKGYISRVMAINDISCNIGKLFGIANTYIIAQAFSGSFIFVANSAIIFAFTFYIVLSNKLSF